MEPLIKKIKVIFFDEAVSFGGSVVVLAHLFNHIDRSRFQPYLVTSLDRQSLEALFKKEDILRWLQPGLHYGNRVKWMRTCPGRSKLLKKMWAYLFTAAAFLANLPEYFALFWKVSRIKPDLIHVNNGSEGPLVSRVFRIPMIWHIHGVPMNFTYKTPQARGEDATFISVSKFISAELVKQGVRSSRIFDIPNPAPAFTEPTISREEWLARYKIPQGVAVFSHVGRLIRWKGQLQFLEAFALITSSCPNTIALIVGDDAEGFSSEYPKLLRKFVADRGLNDRVVFTGHISNILELMSFSDVVVHSSIEPEPFGLVITEAMSARAAVVAANLGAPPEIIEHGVTGLLVDPRNTQEFSEALKLLASDPEKRRQIAAAGAEMVRKRYSVQAFARQVESVYIDTLENLKN